MLFRSLSIAGKPAYVYGWIATAPKPGDLDDDENINRIAIMVRGKMAKDDMLNEIGTTALYSKYIFGELNAEFLDTDEEADITTSSRQDFFDDDERYVVLKKFIESELAQIRADWEAERSEAAKQKPEPDDLPFHSGLPKSKEPCLGNISKGYLPDF